MSQNYEYFGKYILLEKLATGGMAEVWLARAPGAGGIGKFVAIKKILPQFSDNPEFIQMFKDEAAIAMNLSHSNIVSIYEFGQEKSQLFLVMDYVEGRNLRQILNKMKQTSQKFSTDQIVYAVKEIAAGLDHAHRSLSSATGKPLNITHRDMSPQNIMITFEGEVRIVDFGIAKAETQMENTRTGTLKGKFGYMSPEQAEGLATDLRTDIFSLGICLWELLAGERLFIANNEINTLRKIRECSIPSLVKINPNIHPELERITMKALTRDRNLRYQTAAALHRDLNRFLNRQFPDFSPHDFSVFIKTLYTDEILDLRRRLIEYTKIPFRPMSIKTMAEDKTMVTTIPQVTATHNVATAQTSTNVTSTEKSAIEQDPAANWAQINAANASANTNATVTKTEAYDEGGDQIQSINDESLSTQFPTANSTISNETKTQNSASDVLLSNSLSTSSSQPQTDSSKIDPSKPIDNFDDLSLPSFNAGTASSSQSKVLTNPKLPTSLIENVHSDSLFLESGPHRMSQYYNKHKKVERIQVKNKSKTPNHTVNLAIFVVFLITTYVIGISYFPKQTSSLIDSTYNFVVLLSKGEKNAPTQVNTNETTQPENKVPTVAPKANVAAEPKSTPTETQKPNVETQKPNNEELIPTKAATFGLIVNSNPSGAEIFINNIDSGKSTPGRIEIPVSTPFSLTLKLPRFVDYTKTNLTSEITGRTFTATLQKAFVAFVDIDVKPPVNTRIYVNGERLTDEILPIVRYAVPAGVPVTIRAENIMTGLSKETTIKLVEDQRQKILFRFDQSRVPSGQ